MSWRDDLPEIPTQRIHGRVVRDGGERRAAARRRRNTMLTGAGLAAVVVLAVAGNIAVSDPSDDPDTGDATSADTTTAATTAATQAEGTTAGTEAAEDTAAASATTTPFVTDVRVDPTSVWEAPASGPVCGPVALTVTASAPGAHDAVVIVRTTNGLQLERPMILDGDLATVVIDSFPADTVDPGGRAELLIEVVVTDIDGVRHGVAGPVVELLDCPS